MVATVIVHPSSSTNSSVRSSIMRVIRGRKFFLLALPTRIMGVQIIESSSSSSSILFILTSGTRFSLSSSLRLFFPCAMLVLVELLRSLVCIFRDALARAVVVGRHLVPHSGVGRVILNSLKDDSDCRDKHETLLEWLPHYP